jgi:nickel-dependent lactate racemase
LLENIPRERIREEGHMKQVRIEYGDSTMDIEVPDSAVVTPGENFVEPKPLGEPVEATRRALAEPLGSPPLRDLVGPGSKVVIVFPDRVKGGFHVTSHRRVTIPLLVEELTASGVDERNIKLICAIGLHRKNRPDEFEAYLGREIVERFRGERLVNQDPEDPEGIVKLGETDHGDLVEVNRDVVEADLTIVLGHTMGNPYGGYSGGYKTSTTGLTTWRSIRCHHTPSTLHRADFVPASSHSHFRGQLTKIGEKIEGAMKAPFFTVDAVLDRGSRQLGVFAGNTREVEKAGWSAAADWMQVGLEGEKADVLVLGMPRSFHYGPGMGSNPIIMLQAIGSSIVRNARALKPGAVVICASVCDGWFNDEWFPAYREVYELFQRCTTVNEMEHYANDLCSRPEYIQKFRHAFAYHPFHGLQLMYMGGIALDYTRAIYIAGAKAPGFARGMGCIPTRTFEEAMKHAYRYVGEDPKMLVVPAMSKPQVHLRFGD